jgi:hypothetical protein
MRTSISPRLRPVRDPPLTGRVSCFWARLSPNQPDAAIRPLRPREVKSRRSRGTPSATASRLGLVTVEHRRQHCARNRPNIIRPVSQRAKPNGPVRPEKPIQKVRSVRCVTPGGPLACFACGGPSRAGWARMALLWQRRSGGVVGGWRTDGCQSGLSTAGSTRSTGCSSRP